MALRGDTRAQSIGISRFFLTLIVGAVLFWIASRITTPVLNDAMNATNNATANQGTEWFRTAINWIPILIVFLALFSIIALAVFQREVLR